MVNSERTDALAEYIIDGWRSENVVELAPAGEGSDTFSSAEDVVYCAAYTAAETIAPRPDRSGMSAVEIGLVETDPEDCDACNKADDSCRFHKGLDFGWELLAGLVEVIADEPNRIGPGIKRRLGLENVVASALTGKHLAAVVAAYTDDPEQVTPDLWSEVDRRRAERKHNTSGLDQISDVRNFEDGPE